MAISLVAEATTIKATTSNTDYTFNLPNGGSVGEGNLLVVVFACANDANSGAIFTLTDWTKQFEVGNQGANSCECKLSAFIRQAGASEPASYDIANGAASGSHGYMWCAEFSGFDTTTPINQLNTGETAGGGQTSINIPGVTTDVDDCYVLAALATKRASETGTHTFTGTGWTDPGDELVDDRTGGQAWAVNLWLAGRLMSGQGPSNQVTVTPNTGFFEGAFAQLAIAPGAVGPVVTVVKGHPQINRRTIGRR